MKKFILGLVIMLSLYSNAHAGEIYGQLNISGVDLKDDTLDYSNGLSVDYESDTGYGIGAVVGSKLSQNTRIEAELVYRRNDVEALGIDGKYESIALMGNAIYDVNIGSPITPYIGVGAGYANVSDEDLDDDVFAYQAMAGLSYKLTPKTDIMVGYKYFATATPEYDVTSNVTAKFPYRTHNVELGLRFAF